MPVNLPRIRAKARSSIPEASGLQTRKDMSNQEPERTDGKIDIEAGLVHS